MTAAVKGTATETAVQGPHAKTAVAADAADAAADAATWTAAQGHEATKPSSNLPPDSRATQALLDAQAVLQSL